MLAIGTGGLGRIVEYYGPGLDALSAMDRHVIANMGAELGATTTVFPSDQEVRRFLRAWQREEDWMELVAVPAMMVRGRRVNDRVSFDVNPTSRPPPHTLHPMIFVDNGGHTDAHLNLALEEYVLRHKMAGDDLLLFYVNAPAIIIGRNQNTVEEIAADVVAARGIRVVRRVSGGGAVYHDLGNLNFSFMTRDVSGRFNRYDKFNGPVVEVLRELGVPAEIGGRNDILADGRKISGNAQFATPDRMFSHGTVLLDSDLDDVTAVPRPKPGKIESKGLKSVRSRAANISEFLSAPITVDDLRERILERIFWDARPRADPDTHARRGGLARRAGAPRVQVRTWAWNYGQNPACNVQRARRFPGGEIDVRLNVQQGRIAGLRIFGEFMGRADVREARGTTLRPGVRAGRRGRRAERRGSDGLLRRRQSGGYAEHPLPVIAWASSPGRSTSHAPSGSTSSSRQNARPPSSDCWYTAIACCWTVRRLPHSGKSTGISENLMSRALLTHFC